eukprot:NODE_252_length_12846_cov_0.309485.p2 type:complete len:299 gc:universal NODE_252_length_12846_cov_0.309485:5015-5911(+)
MIVCSWNVMSLRSALKKGLVDKLTELNADVTCLQETKLNANEDFAPNLYPYQYFHHSSAKKGYSGTCILSKTKPINITYGIPEFIDDEGRVITAEYEEVFIVNTYVPNASAKLKRLDWKLDWMDHLFKWLNKLKESKNVIWTGDINVSHQPIDLANPSTNQKSAGFSIEERTKLGDFLQIPPVAVKRKSETTKTSNKKVKLENGDSAVADDTAIVPESDVVGNVHGEWIDSYRFLYPTKQEYSYFGFRTKAKERNVGWRLDYFIVNRDYINEVSDIEIKNDYYGLSDHSPVLLTVKNK